jgi:DNA-binding NarL/FixJ family response regulator
MRCLVIDDDPADRELVERFAARAGHEPTLATDGAAGVSLAQSGKYDFALVDLGMPGMDGVATLKALRDKCPDLRLLVLWGFDDKVHVLDAISAGADGYLLKSEVPARLGDAITELTAGGGPMSAKIARFVIDELRHSAEGTRPGGETVSEKSLSKREWDVLEGLSRGYTYAEIAANLQISVNTVRHHIRNLYGKLDVSGKAEAVTRALGGGLHVRPGSNPDGDKQN